MRRTRLLRPSRRPLDSPRRMAARMPWRGARGVRGSATNGRSLDLAAQGQPGVEVRRGEGRVVEVVKQPQLLVQQKGAAEPRVGLLDLAEGGQLADGLTFGRLEQRPARPLDVSGRSG